MAIDYQQILMDMNRPRQRQGRSLKKLLVAATVMIVLGGGGFAVWHFGLADTAWTRATGLYHTVAGMIGLGVAEAAAPASAEEMPGAPAASASASVAAGDDDSLRPRAVVSAPVPRPDGPIDVAANGNAAPRGVQPAASRPTGLRPAASAAASPSVPSVAQPPRQVAAATESVPPARPTAAQATEQGAVPTPALSDALSQIRVIDQMLGSNPAEAMRRLEDMVQNTRLQPDEAAEAGYRMGYAARMLRDEEKAERNWRETVEKYPALRGGRYSALALADTWFHRYAGERAQPSYWDDIQVLYSQVLGQDDAPFLPDTVRAQVKANLNRINDSVLFGSAPTKLARYHRVEAGEMLGSIGNRYRVDYESIARVNGVNPNRIRQGMELKLVVGDVSIVVRKNERDPARTPTVTWFIDGRWAREYPACVGDGAKTPAGTYALNSKERDPSWTNPANGQLLPNDHPENILGSRWMAMKGMNTSGLGIHGTTVDDSIPGYTSAGCIRLLNKDVEELFSFARIGAKVTVLE